MSVLRFHRRVRRALWFHEFAACTLDGAVRWALFVTGIEALINVAFDKIAKQFTYAASHLRTNAAFPFRNDTRLARTRCGRVSTTGPPLRYRMMNWIS